MSAGLPVSATVAAPLALAGWLHWLLVPVLVACEFRRACCCRSDQQAAGAAERFGRFSLIR